MWLWVSTSPGMITFPETSIRSAPSGTGVVAAGPTATIRSPVTTTVPAGIGGPATGMTIPPTNATVGSAEATAAHGAREARATASQASRSVVPDR